MKEALDEAKNELKRADHLIFVSLKYTRTCDVFKSIIERLINSIDWMLIAILKKLKEESKIKEIPPQPGMKCSEIKKHIDDEKILEMIDFYLLLRKISRAEFTRAREYRRHVTMTVCVDEEDREINIDSVTDNYKKTKEYLEYIEELLQK
ncbi:hypothetical protein KY339_00185 [Candidatus Woesearchaeota archaeon]|nr:hypothetical protein [Candidatus Woesearchaeota archaeon]